jgi:molybdenum cofactor biosynthesis protein B
MAYREHRQRGADIVARCAVITLSDTRATATDASGDKIVQLLESAGHKLQQRQLLKDDAALLIAAIEPLLADESVDVILTTGGTGIARRDATISAIERLIDQPLPCFGELFSMLSWQQIGSGAMLSRALAGIARGKPIFAMPGSTAAVELAMTQLILPELGHVLGELRKK